MTARAALTVKLSGAETHILTRAPYTENDLCALPTQEESTLKSIALRNLAKIHATGTQNSGRRAKRPRWATITNITFTRVTTAMRHEILAAPSPSARRSISLS